jgi:glucokinase
LEAFRDKGNFRDFLAQVPIQAVMNKQTPLTGAAYFALGETAIQ